MAEAGQPRHGIEAVGRARPIAAGYRGAAAEVVVVIGRQDPDPTRRAILAHLRYLASH